MKKHKQHKPLPKRPKAGNPGFRPTEDQLQERVEFVLACYGETDRKWQIKAALRKRFGNHLSGRTCEGYIARAREEMARQVRLEHREELRENITKFLVSKIYSAKVAPQAQIRAAECLSQMLGLNEPTRSEISAPDGAPLFPPTPPELKQALEIAYGKGRPDAVPVVVMPEIVGMSGNGHPSGNGHGK